MNARRAKKLRRAASLLPPHDAKRLAISYLNGEVVPIGHLFAGRMLTIKYPAGSRRRAYQDSKNG